MRLVRTLRAGSAPSSRIVVHHNRSFAPLPDRARADLGDAHLLDEHVDVNWGDFSFIEMFLLGVGWIRRNVPDVRWIVFLSGQDYPLRPIAEIEGFLARSDADALLSFRELAACEPAIRDRYRYRFYKQPPWLKGAFRILGLLNARQDAVRFFAGPLPQRHPKLGVRRRRLPFTHDWRCLKGMPWGCFSPRAVDALFCFVTERPDIVRYFRRCHIPEEAFLQTVLANDARIRVHNDSKRYARWTGGSPHPEVLRLHDLDALKACGQHFARKCDEAVDAAVLDRLDEWIGTPLAGQRHPGGPGETARAAG